MQAKVIFSSEIAKASANLESILAYVYEDGTVEYWGNLSKAIARKLYDEAMNMMATYSLDMVGSTASSEILGCLEDTYPEWVEEFEGI
jgi:hypothetical protein